MWCAAKRVDCYHCGIYGECRRGSCYLPNAEPSTLGTSSFYLVNTASEKSIDDIKREAVKDFSEKLKERCHNYYPSIDHYCCSVKAVSVKDINELLKEYDK